LKVFLETFGCQMNRLDSELITGSLISAGHEFVRDRKSAEVVLYNTCSVRAHAEDRVHSRLGADGQRKADRKSGLIVGVLGCMAQRYGRSLLKRHPHVDIVCGPGQIHRLAELISQVSMGQRVIRLDPSRTDKRDAESEERMDWMDLLRDPSPPGASRAQAYVRVMRGCDNFCTYCIVPFVRGAERSRDPNHIVREVARLVDAGRTEITLLGQKVNSYIWRDGQAVRFSDLLARISAVAGLRRLRFVTSHPVDFTDDILQAMRDLPNVCPYIHCPAQSGSDTVLKRMNRRYTRSQYDDLICRARETVPEVVLAGDFIVGFPGESESDHETSADLIRRSGYKNTFIFKYSPRPGTIAASKYEDDVPTSVKKRRNNDLLAVQAEVGLAHHQSCVGSTVEILVEGPSPRSEKQAKAARPDCTQMIGRTRGDHIVVFDGDRKLAGRYIDVRITGADSLLLFGRLSHS